MTATGARREGVWIIGRRIERPEAVVLALVLTGLVVYGWFAPPFWLAVAIAGQLAIGGMGAVWVIGPVRSRFGFARYATLAVAGVALTLLGQMLNSTAQLVAAPIVAILLFGVLWFELRLPEGRAPRLSIDLTLVGIVFAAAAGIAATFPTASWPPAVLLVVIAAAVPALRAAELRGRYGVEAVGQAALHLLAIAQLGASLALLHLPGVVGSAVLALGFHAWAGAAEALDNGARARAVAVEFGSLALLGLLVALLLRPA
jgi:predicted membrane channel-forming protein YqfA (hemolysin III family)